MDTNRTRGPKPEGAAGDFSKFSIMPLLSACGRGNNEATGQLYDLLSSTVRRTARRWLWPGARPAVTSEDIMQLTFARFFTLSSLAGRFPDERAVLGYLNKIARNKAVDQTRRAQKGGRSEVEVPLENAAAPTTEATPAKIAEDRDILDYFASTREWGPVIVQAMRDGLTKQEAAEQAGVSDRAVRRMISSARERCRP